MMTRRDALATLLGTAAASGAVARAAGSTSAATRDVSIRGYTHALLPREHGQFLQLSRPLSRRYPSREHCMQLAAFFAGERALLVMTQDERAAPVDWEIVPGEYLRLHFNGGKSDVVVESVEGRIEAVAERYARWALRQSWAKRHNPMLVPPRFIFTAATAQPREQLRHLARLLEQIPEPTAAWLTQYRRWPFDTQYPDYAAAEPGEFAQLIATLAERDCTALPYVNALLWDAKNSQFSLGAKIALRDATGAMRRYSPRHTSLTYACPADERWQAIIRTIRNSWSLKTSRSSGIYLDMLLAVPAQLCFANDHGHAPGDPHAWGRGIRTLLDGMQGLIMTEGCAEPYLDQVDLLLMHLYTKSADAVPLWSLVYGPVTTPVGWSVDPEASPQELQAAIDGARRFGVGACGTPWMQHASQEKLLDVRYAAQLARVVRESRVLQ